MRLSKKILKIIKECQQEGLVVAGIDEVGRGSIFGPVIAAAVILKPKFFDKNIDDSKKIKEEKRKPLSDLIKKNSVYWSIGDANVSEINQINIHKATLLAMQRAIDRLVPQPDLVLVDGPWKIPDLDCKQISVIKGDSKVFPIACASIVAKVYRDVIMMQCYAKNYANYDLEHNKGYRSPKHFKAMIKHGTTPLHRNSFKDVQRAEKKSAKKSKNM